MIIILEAMVSFLIKRKLSNYIKKLPKEAMFLL